MSGDQPPSIEKPKGPYPTYVANRFGKVVPVVQVYCYTKYLGHLELNFDHQVNFANSQIYYIKSLLNGDLTNDSLDII